MKKVAVLGDGAWGTAIATVLAHNGYTVSLWCYNADLVDHINHNHLNNRYLPDILLSPSIIASASITQVVQDAEWIFEAIPVKYLRDVITKAQGSFASHQKWITLSKGIEQESFMLVSQIIQDILGKEIKVVAVSGPSFAADVAHKQLTAVMVAADTNELAVHVSHLLSCDYVKAYASTDVIGVQLSGALKNVITLAVAMLEGAGYSDTTRAFVLTKGLHEIEQLVIAMGGKKETVYGLAGIADLVLTAYSDQSKNAQVGKKLGQGMTLETILAQTGYIPEGINTVKSVVQLADRFNLSLPLCRSLHTVIFEQRTIAQFLKDIVSF